MAFLTLALVSKSSPYLLRFVAEGESVPLYLGTTDALPLSFTPHTACCLRPLTFSLAVRRFHCPACGSQVARPLTDGYWRPRGMSDGLHIMSEWAELVWSPLTAGLAAPLLSRWASLVAHEVENYFFDLDGIRSRGARTVPHHMASAALRSEMHVAGELASVLETRS